MTSLGTVSGTLHQVTTYGDIAYPASGHCAESGAGVELQSAFPTGTTYTYFPVGGGFWVEGVIDAVPQGQPLPVQVTTNWFSPSDPAGPTSPPGWRVDVVLYADDVFELLGATSYDHFRLHVVAYYIVNDIEEAVDVAST